MTIRDLGKGIVDLVRPDGGKTVTGGLASTISKGVVDRITGFGPAKAVDKILNGSSTTKQDANKPLTTVKNLPSVIKNPLENFASYSPIWTLACIDKKQFNNPASYRNSPADLKYIVMSSGGRFDKQRVNTASGTPEFFINNFTMKATVAAGGKTGNTNAFKFEWDIYEPYSMGLLLQSLQIAADKAGYVNYLNNAPFVLRLDFAGYDEEGRQYKVVKPKFFTLKLTAVKFQVNEGGSTYKMEAIPYNHSGFSDSINTMFNDVKITAGAMGTVEEALATGSNSLVKVLNDVEQRMLEDKKIKVKDIYDIQFPTSSSQFNRVGEIKEVTTATVDPNAAPKITISGKPNVEAKIDFETNDIGKSSFGFSQSKGGNFVAKREIDQRDPKTGIVKRDGMTIDPKNRSFQFGQGQTLTAIINQIVLSSEYVKEAINPNSKVGKVDGFIKWFRLDVQIELLDFDDSVGDYAKKITYRIVPFLVHESIFSNPNYAPDYKQLQSKICKGYDYIYSGQNVDILKFDININNMFFTGVTPGTEKDSAKAADPNTASGSSTQKNKNTSTGKGPATGAQFATGGRSRPKPDPEQLEKKRKGGSNQQDTEQAVAESFHKAFVDGQTEMITVNLEVLGDPYWLVDSGMGNYFSPGRTNNKQQTEDGTMNYEEGDVYIYISFKTPADVSESTGLYEFSKLAKESPFSGIYKVTGCESQFNEGTFKQKLACIRMPGQAIDYANNPPELKATIKRDPATTSAIAIGSEERAKTSPTDNPTEDTGKKG